MEIHSAGPGFFRKVQFGNGWIVSTTEKEYELVNKRGPIKNIRVLHNIDRYSVKAGDELRFGGNNTIYRPPILHPVDTFVDHPFDDATIHVPPTLQDLANKEKRFRLLEAELDIVNRSISGDIAKDAALADQGTV